MRRTLLCLAHTVAVMSVAAADPYIWVNLSIKAAVNPADGTYPGGATLAQIESQFDQAVARANEHYGPYWRGYRFRRIEPVQSIGALGDYDGPGRWSLLFIGENNLTAFAVVTNPVPYRWNPGAINIYCYEVPRSNAPPHGFGPGGAFFACNSLVECLLPDQTNLLVYHTHHWSEGWQVAHEAGHFFGLIHTFGGSQCGSNSVTNNLVPGDDLISTTLPEVDCWSRDMIALSAYGVIYASLTNDQQRTLVDDTYFNLMSYHSGLSGEPRDQVTVRLTEEQLDRFTDFANDPTFARPMVSGTTHFVSTNGDDTLGGTHSSIPKRHVQAALTNASRGDVVLLRPGAYNERLTITNSLTLRATRSGWATIGRN